MLIRRIGMTATAFLAICAMASPAWACPMCKFALESDDPTPKAYMISILFMLVAIGSVVGGLIAFLCWLSKNEKAVMNAAGYQHLFENGVSQHAKEGHSS